MEKKKILLVEDDQFLRTLYSDLLKSQGYYVETAQDGEEAYNKIKANGWDLILLDIILPKLDGLEIIKKLKIEKSLNLKKIICLTNLDQTDTNSQLKQEEIFYLIKSQFNPEQFLNQIKSFLNL